ncbi:MAG: RNA polymerase sigma factor [Armatimonadetes bacterium]|nr:RNA polymerase sigma factor [Armatimonadota bacterium]
MQGIDRSLVERLRRGDAVAYELVIDELRAPVYRFLLRLCGDTGNAEDLTQETFLAIWRGIGAYQGRSQFKTWVFGIAYRQHLRQRDKRTVETVELIESDLSDMSDVSTVVAEAEEHALIRRAVYGLPNPYRDVVCLIHLDGLTYRDVAEVLGVPIGTVKSRMNGAFKLLREKLGECEVEGDDVRQPEGVPGRRTEIL